MLFLCKFYLLHILIFLSFNIIIVVVIADKPSYYKFNEIINDGGVNPKVLNDLRQAFKIIINATKEADNIIRKMYNLSMKQTNPTMIFKIPKPNDKGYEMLWMQRNEFAEPIFPNLTAEYMRLMVKKTENLIRTTQTKLSTYNSHKHQQQQYKHSPFDFSVFGLNDWTGQTLLPFHRDNIESNFVNITWRQMHGSEKDKNVYIARANDPFGYSVKWQPKNKTFTLPTKSVIITTTDAVHDNNRYREERSKRGVLQLASMIKCQTGCEPLGYVGYGCYCGFLGSGVPIDGVDRCCRTHDKCYEQTNCISFLEYFVPYVWICYRGKSICAIDHGVWGGPQSCAARLCSCDLRLARCLRQYNCPRRRPACSTSKARRLKNLLFFK